MKVEHLYEIAWDIKEELANLKIPGLLESLTNALQNQVNSPSPDHLNQISNYRNKLENALKESETNKYPPAWIHDLEAMGIAEYLGTNLSATIKDIFTRNAITYNDALTELNKIKKQLNTINTHLNNLTGALEHFDFYVDTLEPGEFEVGVTIPRSAIDDELGQLGKELGKINQILLTMSEVATNKREPFKIHNLSTSDPTIYIYCSPEVAAMVAGAITWLLCTYKQVQEIRINQHNLKDLISKKTLQSLQHDADEKIRVSIDEYIKKVEKEHLAKMVAGRKNELKIELQKSLEELARRIDKGYGFDVHGEDLEEEKAEEGKEKPTPSKEAIAVKKLYELVANARQEIRAFQPQDKPILCLPPAKEDESDDGDKDPPSKTTKKS